MQLKDSALCGDAAGRSEGAALKLASWPPTQRQDAEGLLEIQMSAAHPDFLNLPLLSMGQGICILDGGGK